MENNREIKEVTVMSELMESPNYTEQLWHIFPFAKKNPTLSSLALLQLSLNCFYEQFGWKSQIIFELKLYNLLLIIKQLQLFLKSKFLLKNIFVSRERANWWPDNVFEKMLILLIVIAVFVNNSKLYIDLANSNYLGVAQR